MHIKIIQKWIYYTISRSCSNDWQFLLIIARCNSLYRSEHFDFKIIDICTKWTPGPAVPFLTQGWNGSSICFKSFLNDLEYLTPCKCCVIRSYTAFFRNVWQGKTSTCLSQVQVPRPPIFESHGSWHLGVESPWARGPTCFTTVKPTPSAIGRLRFFAQENLSLRMKGEKERLCWLKIHF